jgi:prepilin-type N-terminal cleavage/methylation domain-containing protein
VNTDHWTNRWVHGRTSPASRRFPARPAFTLVELLIVVAVLAMVLTLSLPSLRKLSVKSELRNAARQVRVAVLQARLAAIESGELTFFHYQPGGGCFESGRGAKLAALPSQADGPLDAAELDSPDSAATATDEVIEPQTLPLGVRFADPAAEGSPQLPATDGELPDAGSWSTPMVFYPNGRTRNARIVLMTEDYRIELAVRGLTGTVQISQVERLVPAEDETSAAGEEGLP